MARGSEIVVFDIQQAFHLFFFFLLQHHMSGLGKLMNYPHRGRDGACKLHYPTSHNMELFEFIELRVEFSHTDLTHFKIILGPLFLSSRWQSESLSVFVSQKCSQTQNEGKVHSARWCSEQPSLCKHLLWSNQMCVCESVCWIPWAANMEYYMFLNFS